MRILFISGVDVGGAPRSTLELAYQLVRRGHEIGVVLGSAESPGRLVSMLTAAAIKLRQRTGRTWLRAMVRPLGAGGGHGAADEGVTVWHRRHPENDLRGLLREFRPGIVIANSLSREAMRWVLEDCVRHRTPLGLYMREEHSITHLTVSALPLDFVIANSEHLAQEARSAGYSCTMVPSIVDLGTSEVSSTRREVVLVNPVAENRPDVLVELARSRPDIPCVLQESWDLPSEWRHVVQAWVDSSPNLELRPPTTDPADIYRHARLLVAPYPSGRPRVVLEAQHNGIPVVALAQPASSEAVGPGGVLLAADLSAAQWSATIASLWDDPAEYARLSEAAYRHARRDEIAVDNIVAAFEAAIEGVAA